MRTVVIGVGNPTLTDDGVGPHAVRELSVRMDADPDVDVAELCAGGLRLMEAMAGYDRAIVVDALVVGDLPAGTTVELNSDDLVGTKNLGCAHDMSLPYALDLGRVTGVALPAEIRILGVRAMDVTTFGEALTAPVAAMVPALVDRLLSLLGQPAGAAYLERTQA